MSWVATFAKSSVGKKNVMAITGLALCGFLVTHLLGNFLLLVSPEAFNKYGHALITNPLLIPAEIVLALLFFSHIGLALKLTRDNHHARSERYHMKVRSGHGATFASSTMIYTGLITLVFLVLHLIHFKFGPVYEIEYDGVVMRDLYKTVFETFQNPGIVAWYVFASLSLALHVSHGFQSSFQSLGFRHPKYTPFISLISKLYAVFIGVGYSALPICLYLKGGN